MNTDFHLLVFGPGYSARAFMARAKQAGWRVSATFRKPEDEEKLKQEGYYPIAFSELASSPNAMDAAPNPVTHIVTSVAPSREDGTDPVLEAAGPWLSSQSAVQWIGYLSSTNVYGDHGGAWVDETTKPKPSLLRGKRRLLAEQSWLSLGNALGARTHIFRLAGIYGPGKNALKTVLSGKAKRIFKEGQMFGRIHRDDIAKALWLGANGNAASGVFNLSDDRPAPPQDVIEEAAKLLGLPMPPLVSFEDADLSPMGRSFYEENKKVSNQRAKDILDWVPDYPDYKMALAKMLPQES